MALRVINRPPVAMVQSGLHQTNANGKTGALSISAYSMYNSQIS